MTHKSFTLFNTHTLAEFCQWLAELQLHAQDALTVFKLASKWQGFTCS